VAKGEGWGSTEETPFFILAQTSYRTISKSLCLTTQPCSIHLPLTRAFLSFISCLAQVAPVPLERIKLLPFIVLITDDEFADKEENGAGDRGRCWCCNLLPAPCLTTAATQSCLIMAEEGIHFVLFSLPFILWRWNCFLPYLRVSQSGYLEVTAHRLPSN